ncbi:MAG TPA: nucleotide exchange factor GrpE [Bacillota bacterium]|jgi:molecular chaperone GrpE|nr:nucleotide exchange factor GrpE [Bacillota bacterium]HOL08801.1 nucleotide exchange factor GrpE [Bacillota bacterium]HPO96891.1 nucleotide exchange factor GrpE [Bacillota bacterium]
MLKKEVEESVLETDEQIEADINETVKEDVSETVGDNQKLVELTNEIEALKQEKEDLYNRLLRTQADFDNFRRRSRKELEQASIYGGEELLKKILPVLDNLERAVASFNEQSDNSSWQEGVQLTLRQFKEILTAEGLEAVESLNQPFDPQVHEAVMQEESEAVTEPMITMEIQKGYKYKDKLIRPAIVKVAVPKN